MLFKTRVCGDVAGLWSSICSGSSLLVWRSSRRLVADANTKTSTKKANAALFGSHRQDGMIIFVVLLLYAAALHQRLLRCFLSVDLL